VTRVLSGAVLIAIAVGVVWFAPLWMFEIVAAVVTVAAVYEVVQLAHASGLAVARIPALAAALVVLGAMSAVPVQTIRVPLAAVLMIVSVASGLVVLGTWNGGGTALASASAALFPTLYVALPVGALGVIREKDGPGALFLLMLTVIVSDTAQYYTGRLLGRRPLSPAISPGKTIEGLFGGLVFGTLVFVVLGAWWAPRFAIIERVALGAVLVAIGVAGDLFESMLKRSAGVKDSSALIPGHGGILDRIDALIFAAPVYYLFVKYT
jgi:phosphatidate cytidylyltransferase